MLFSLWLDCAFAREVTIAVVDEQGRALPEARLTTPCGCGATIDAATGVWRGEVIPGPNGSVALVRGAVIDLEISAVGYQTTHVRYRVGWRPNFVVELRPLPPLDLEEFTWECGWGWYERRVDDGGSEEASVSAFTPPPPPSSPPPAGWDCRKRH